MYDIFSIAGKTALVTGGGRGIGAMITRGFVEAGAKVYIASRNPEPGERLAEELKDAIGECIPLTADLSTLDNIHALATELSQRESKLDILVNNAGAAAMAPLDSFSEADWDAVMDVNTKSVFFTIQALLPLIRASASDQASARIINIASQNGVKTPDHDIYSYSASKAACIMLTRHLAKRLAKEHILVNSISPGPFPTDMIAPILDKAGDALAARNPLQRLGEPSDIIGAAIYLASRASAWTTGANIPCDGGGAQL